MKLFLVTAIVLFSFDAFAQDQCNTDLQHKRLMNDNENYAAGYYELQRSINSLTFHDDLSAVSKAAGEAQVVMPLVFHILHTGDTVGSIHNPSAAKIDSLVDYINKAYAAEWDKFPKAGNGGVKVPIRFELARLVPDCRPANPIVRIDGRLINGYIEYGLRDDKSEEANNWQQIFDNYAWDRYNYYNVFIVHKMYKNNTLGWATRPNNSYFIDATVLLSTQAFPGAETPVHELAHAFDISHVFEGDTDGKTCPPSYGCDTTGDKVCDTDPVNSWPDCKLAANPCTALPYNGIEQNFMGYSTCGRNRFTQGQADRIGKIISVLPRVSLTRSVNNMDNSRLLSDVNLCFPGTRQLPGDDVYGPEGFEFNSMAVHIPLHDLRDNVYKDYSCLYKADYKVGAANRMIITTRERDIATAIYIDKNGDGLFTGNERIYNDRLIRNRRYTVYLRVTPQNVVFNRELRMRIICDTVLQQDKLSPCLPPMAGIVRDFSVTMHPSDSWSADEILLYPNPASNSLTITNSSDMPDAKVVIYNSLGKVVKVLESIKAYATINIAELSSGVYTISIIATDGKNTIRKFVKV